jgi:ADP-ribosyl-[dinitrogen reductase] hydrolase
MNTRNTRRSDDGRLILAGWVKVLDPDEIFVFGSNARGKHGSGAARIALDHFGAVYGKGHGLHGQSYAIDTMTDESTMASEIKTLIAFASQHPELTFLVTELGCGIGPYTPADVAPYLADAGPNVVLPESFAAVLRDRASATLTAPDSEVSATTTVTPSPGENAPHQRRPLGASVSSRGHGKQAPASLTAAQLDRAVGSIIGGAAGDALGAPYEFGPARNDDFVPQFGVGTFGHAPGEWTDDTAMAMPILEALARGDSLRDERVLGRIVEDWDGWSRDAKDVGSQTRSVLRRIGGDYTEAAARDAAQAHHVWSGKSAGNGSLMRTGPVALGYLVAGREKRLAEAAGRIAQLTHWEDDNVDATIIWSSMIRSAILTGELDLWSWVPLFGDATPRYYKWATIIDAALGHHPRDFQEQNGWVVRAFQAALSAVWEAGSAQEAIYRAIRGGGDTDTVAAIAGALAGARWGGTQIPLSWQRRLHGWPGYRVNDLARLAILAARRGQSDRRGWPDGDSVLDPRFRHTDPVRHPSDPGVWLGSQSALSSLPESIGAVVSLGRLGTSEIPPGIESVRVWLIDTDGENLNLDWTLTDATDVIAELRAEGTEVFVHCAEARSRTSSVAALYAARHCGVPLDQAWRDVDSVLPYFNPAPFLQAAVKRVARDV